MYQAIIEREKELNGTTFNFFSLWFDSACARILFLLYSSTVEISSLSLEHIHVLADLVKD